MSASRSSGVVVVACLLLLLSASGGVAGPCCIVIVPPPPSPPPKDSLSASFGEIYAQLPLFAAIEKNLFGTLKVTIERAQFAEAATKVASGRGVVGVGPINKIAEFNSKSNTLVQIAAVLIDRPDYALFTRQAGPDRLAQLTGQEIGIPAIGSLEHLYALKAVRAGGLPEAAVRFAVAPSWANPSTKALADLKQGKVAAVPLFLGFASSKYQLRQLQGAPVTLPSWVAYVGPITLGEELNEVIQFIKALQQGLTLVNQDRSMVNSILSKQFRLSDDVSVR